MRNIALIAAIAIGVLVSLAALIQWESGRDVRVSELSRGKGTAWERTPWHAMTRAAWEALKRTCQEILSGGSQFLGYEN